MKSETYQVEIITPCFCAGANPTEAEIRPTAIRGQLRWWFRALGGSFSEEQQIFGGINAKDDQGNSKDEGISSALVVRVSKLQRAAAWARPQLFRNAPEAYIYYFAKASSNGVRWSSDTGHIPPGSTFCLTLLWRRKVSGDLMQKFVVARDAFLRFGAMGLRVTRGLGAFVVAGQTLSREEFAQAAQPLIERGFEVRLNDTRYADFERLLQDAGAWLKHEFRRKYSSRRPSPLGSTPDRQNKSLPRQTSALYFRPVRFGNGFGNGEYGLVAFEAPHRRVLGTETPPLARPVLKEVAFQGEPPKAQPGKSRY